MVMVEKDGRSVTESTKMSSSKLIHVLNEDEEGKLLSSVEETQIRPNKIVELIEENELSSTISKLELDGPEQKPSLYPLYQYSDESFKENKKINLYKDESQQVLSLLEEYKFDEEDDLQTKTNNQDSDKTTLTITKDNRVNTSIQSIDSRKTLIIEEVESLKRKLQRDLNRCRDVDRANRRLGIVNLKNFFVKECQIKKHSGSQTEEDNKIERTASGGEIKNSTGSECGTKMKEMTEKEPAGEGEKAKIKKV